MIPLPDWLRQVLPWLLVQTYLVAGLLRHGDLPGAPEAVLRLGLLAGVLSLLLGLLSLLLLRGKRRPQFGTWVLAGTLPWALAFLLEGLTGA